MSENPEHLYKVYLGLGSNLGHSLSILNQAVSAIEKAVGKIDHISRLYLSSPLNPPGSDMQQNDYYNMALKCHTTLNPREVLLQIRQIETELGLDRSKKEYWGPRIIDIDILYIDDLQIEEPDLIVPHPQIQNRDFVLLPLADIDPLLSDPRSGLSIMSLIDALNSRGVSLIKEIRPFPGSI